MNINTQIAKQIAETLKEELIYDLYENEKCFVLMSFEYQRFIKIFIYKTEMYMKLEIDKYIHEKDITLIGSKNILYKDFLQNRIISNKDFIMYNKSMIEESIWELEQKY